MWGGVEWEGGNIRDGAEEDPAEDTQFGLRDESHGRVVVCFGPCAEFLSKIVQTRGRGRLSGCGAGSGCRGGLPGDEVSAWHEGKWDEERREGERTLRSWG